MNLFAQLTEKPWHMNAHAASLPAMDRLRTYRTGLKVLLMVISTMFLLFFVAFLMRAQYADWRPLAEAPGQPLYRPFGLWLNSLWLVLASLSIWWAKRAGCKQRYSLTLWTLLGGGLFAAAFVMGQWSFWQQLLAQGHLVNDQPALSFFYLFTGLHGLHVLAGLVGWLVTLRLVFKAGPQSSELVAQAVAMCGLYWHFLLGLWAALFGLLMMKPSTYEAIAAFCGLR